MKGRPQNLAGLAAAVAFVVAVAAAGSSLLPLGRPAGLVEPDVPADVGRYSLVEAEVERDHADPGPVGGQEVTQRWKHQIRRVVAGREGD